MDHRTCKIHHTFIHHALWSNTFCVGRESVWRNEWGIFESPRYCPEREKGKRQTTEKRKNERRLKRGVGREQKGRRQRMKEKERDRGRERGTGTERETGRERER